MKTPDIGHYIKQMVESALKKSIHLFIPNTLKMQIHFYLIVLLMMISLKSNNTPHASTQFSPSETHEQHQKPDNQTIYKVSKALCWGCIGESFQFLFAHNWIRAQKWEIPLMWDYNLERYAKWWAEQRKPDCKLQHSFPEGDFKLGENIYWGSGTRWTPGDAVNAWAGEEKFYDYGSNSCVSGEMCGHYTQIVWKNTRRVGCARVVCDDGDLFMNCNYDPPGNYIGERPY